METGSTATAPKGRFDYVRYDEIAQQKQDTAKGFCMQFESFILGDIPPGRAQALALTKLEEVYMWLGKAIRDDQVQKRGAELQEERANQ